MSSARVLAIARDHVEVSRRFFLQLGAVGAAALSLSPRRAEGDIGDDALTEAIGKLEYLTRSTDFTIVSRGNPRPDQLPADKRLEVGLDPKTWALEVVADPESDS